MNAVPQGRPLRVGIAGAGAISQYHLAGWREQAGVELAAICDPVADSARARAEAFGIPRSYDGFAAMLAAERLDAVDIITPVGTHAPLARMAADAGVHLCLQKPMCATVAEARALVDYVGERVRFMVHENYRWRPHYVAVRRWLDEGRIGTPSAARMSVRGACVYTGDGSAPFLLQRQPYLKEFRRLLVFEVLIHHLDALRVLLGPLSVEHCSLGRVNAALAGEDVALAVLRGRDGLGVLVDGHIAAPGYGPMPADRLEITGTAATLVFDRDRLWLEGKPETLETFDLQKNYQACFSAAVREFVDGLRTGRGFATDRLDNLQTLELMEACYLAAGVQP
ncbi:MAG: Gfo/Idh/MocA family oxidoreductase [Betaproteobacteria bacterium]